MASSERGGFVRLPWFTTREVHEFLGDGRRPLARHVDRRRRPVLYVSSAPPSRKRRKQKAQLVTDHGEKRLGLTKLDRRLGCPCVLARLGNLVDGDVEERISPAYSGQFFLDEMSVRGVSVGVPFMSDGAAHRAPMWSFLAASVRLMRRSPLSASRGPVLSCSRTRESWDGGGMNFPRRRGMVWCASMWCAVGNFWRGLFGCVEFKRFCLPCLGDDVHI